MLLSLALSPAMTPSSDASVLLEACRQGDSAAWKRLYDVHFEFAHRTARRLGVSPGDVEDVVHEAFTVAWRKLADFHTGRFSTWFYQIISHEVTAYLRKKRVRAFFTGRWADETDHEVSSAEGSVAARHSLSQVEQVLAKLSSKKREVFVLFELEGLPHEQIAEMVGCPPQTVRTRLHSARRDFEAIARKRGVWP